jgi:hypothetical protein
MTTIALAAVRPQFFNPVDFEKDIIEDGLVCWRRSNPRRSSSDDDDDGTGQPWDTRTWEAKPWFRKKWRMLLDGEEGDHVVSCNIWNFFSTVVVSSRLVRRNLEAKKR